MKTLIYGGPFVVADLDQFLVDSDAKLDFNVLRSRGEQIEIQSYHYNEKLYNKAFEENRRAYFGSRLPESERVKNLQRALDKMKRQAESNRDPWERDWL